MKTIQISNQTFGALWQKAHEADQTEEDILRRLLGLSGAASEAPASGVKIRIVPPDAAAPSKDGFYDHRFDVRFAQGFRIFRSYKGKNYSATANSGKWDLSGHLMPYDSLNALNVAIGAKSENAWISWFYEQDGLKTPIDNLRKRVTIKRRLL